MADGQTFGSELLHTNRILRKGRNLSQNGDRTIEISFHRNYTEISLEASKEIKHTKQNGVDRIKVAQNIHFGLGSINHRLT
jgi:hypothetical protein